MKFNDRDEIIALTPLWKGERFPDGRPKVEQKYIDEMYKMTLEELWKPIYLKGYESQFEGDLKTLHDDGRKLIGRAVTATYVPTRPDLLDVAMGQGKKEGRKGNFNQWVIDTLVEGDVVIYNLDLIGSADVGAVSRASFNGCFGEYCSVFVRLYYTLHSAVEF